MTVGQGIKRLHCLLSRKLLVVFCDVELYPYILALLGSIDLVDLQNRAKETCKGLKKIDDKGKGIRTGEKSWEEKGYMYH